MLLCGAEIKNAGSNHWGRGGSVHSVTNVSLPLQLKVKAGNTAGSYQ